MSYQVLARKWRPRSFDTLVGQEHVVRALTHALNTQRLHHAWLFTGTRGVGKTTLSRILAKSLNCEKGVSAYPCGQCYTCTAIDQGKMTDYIELDAASNRGVDEMTQLLEQAVYSPTVGRYKVYMIDEVHMLTGHAFNAMLKTLEEPPEHVKFILATTDPQKIPVTVLSRCLQFNLKQMLPDSIVEHLQSILAAENITADRTALRLLAKAAQGSMRDALSLTDQAIAFSAGNLTIATMEEMLGAIDQTYLLRLFVALLQKDSAQLWQIIQEMQARSFSFTAALTDLAQWVAQLAILQKIPEHLPVDDVQVTELTQLAQKVSAEQLQLIYTLLVHSQTEIGLAPDACAGFLMILLRLQSFLEPVSGLDGLTPAATAPAVSAPVVAPPPVVVAPTPVQTPKSIDSPPKPIVAIEPVSPALVVPESVVPEPVVVPSAPVETNDFADVADDFEFPDASNWTKIALQLPLKGLALELAKNTEWVELTDTDLVLKVSNKSLAQSNIIDRLSLAVQQYMGVEIGVKIIFSEDVTATAQIVQQQVADERQQLAERSIHSDAAVQEMVSRFDGTIIEGSIRPITT